MGNLEKVSLLVNTIRKNAFDKWQIARRDSKGQIQEEQKYDIMFVGRRSWVQYYRIQDFVQIERAKKFKTNDFQNKGKNVYMRYSKPNYQLHTFIT